MSLYGRIPARLLLLPQHPQMGVLEGIGVFEAVAKDAVEAGMAKEDDGR